MLKILFRGEEVDGPERAAKFGTGGRRPIGMAMRVRRSMGMTQRNDELLRRNDEYR